MKENEKQEQNKVKRFFINSENDLIFINVNGAKNDSFLLCSINPQRYLKEENKKRNNRWLFIQ